MRIFRRQQHWVTERQTEAGGRGFAGCQKLYPGPALPLHHNQCRLSCPQGFHQFHGREEGGELRDFLTSLAGELKLHRAIWEKDNTNTFASVQIRCAELGGIASKLLDAKGAPINGKLSFVPGVDRSITDIFRGLKVAGGGRTLAPPRRQSKWATCRWMPLCKSCAARCA